MGISVRNHRDNTSRSRIVTAINKMGGACTSRRILWLPRSRPLVGILHVISFLLRTETFPPSLSLPPPPLRQAAPRGPLPNTTVVRPPARGHLQLCARRVRSPRRKTSLRLEGWMSFSFCQNYYRTEFMKSK